MTHTKNQKQWGETGVDDNKGFHKGTSETLFMTSYMQTCDTCLCCAFQK